MPKGKAAARTVLHGASDAFAVVVGTSFLVAPFNGPCRALYVGTGGDVTVTMVSGSSAEFKNGASGTILDVQVTEVTAVTGAADILALY